MLRVVKEVGARPTGDVMARGGARNRSGPQPDPMSGRSDARGLGSLTSCRRRAMTARCRSSVCRVRLRVSWRCGSCGVLRRLLRGRVSRGGTRLWRTTRALGGSFGGPGGVGCDYGAGSSSWRSAGVDSGGFAREWLGDRA